MMVQSAWTNEGRNSGDATGPSSAMAAMEVGRRRPCCTRTERAAAAREGERE
jgi:hypothetical protein